MDETALEDGEGEVATVNPPHVWRFMRENVEPIDAPGTIDVDKFDQMDDADDGEIFTPLPSTISRSKMRSEREKAEKVASQRSQANSATSKKKKNTDGNLPRGKRGKIKKMKKKYRDQDEEDRKLAMKLLGHKVDDVDKKERSEVEAHLPASSPSHPSASAPQGQMRRESNREAIDDDIHGNNVNAPAAATEEGPIAAKTEDHVLRQYTGCPKPGHSLIHALPFCGPIAAMQHFKYRVKLTPGTTKRGRAVKTAVALFTARMPGDASAKERELIKRCPDQVCIHTMRSAVKLAAAGLGKVQKKMKQKKKQKKKGK